MFPLNNQCLPQVKTSVTIGLSPGFRRGDSFGTLFLSSIVYPFYPAQAFLPKLHSLPQRGTVRSMASRIRFSSCPLGKEKTTNYHLKSNRWYAMRQYAHATL